MNLLDLPIAPRRGRGVYWATILASLVIHGGFLAYVLGYARSLGQPSRPAAADVNLEVPASPPVPALARGDREVLPRERAAAGPPSRDRGSVLPDAEAPGGKEATPGSAALASHMHDALPEDNAVAAQSPPSPETTPNDRLAVRLPTVTALPARRARAPMSMPSRRMALLPGEERLSEHRAADPQQTADKTTPAPAPSPPLELLAMAGHDAPDAASEERRALPLDMSAQGQPVVAVLPKEAGIAMLSVRIIDNAPSLPEDRASPPPADTAAPPPEPGPSAAAAASPAIAPAGKTRTQAVAERAKPGKTKAKPELSPAKTDGYRALVRSHLAAHRPAGGAVSGAASVSFRLSPKGRVLSARIAHSSGNPAIDQSIVQSVYGAEPFPKPPEGMPAKHLRFVISFEFR